jgi:predicted GNAT family acetyltransferase
MTQPHPLDGVIWNALSTRQAHLAEATGKARRFLPEVSVLAGLADPTAQAYADLAQLCAPGDRVSLWDTKPYEPQPGWETVAAAPLFQMILEVPLPKQDRSPLILTLGASDVPEMLELTRLTRPGPFSQRTHELGMYLGIRAEGQLVAMCGERLRVPVHAEMSAICTHPDHLGKGYAGLLMREVARQMIARGDVPFLHVRQDNTRAIGVYERMGFRVRASFDFAVLRRV